MLYTRGRVAILAYPPGLRQNARHDTLALRAEGVKSVHLCYDELSPRGSGGPSFDRIDATRGWLRHLGNLLFLEFVAGNPTASWQERQQANHEIPLAKRKMAWMERHPNFDQPSAEQGKRKLLQQWKR